MPRAEGFSTMPQRPAMLLPAIFLLLAAAPALAHDGYLDSYGCHYVQATGRYHCHRGPLAGKSFKSKDEMREALRDVEQRERRAPAIPSAPYAES